MKQKLLLLVAMPLLSLTIIAQPSLTKKSLETSPAVTNVQITTESGARNLIREAGFTPSGDYTIEVKSKIGANNTRGLDIEAQTANQKGFRYSIAPASLINNNDITAPAVLNSEDNATDFETFRFAVEGDNVHIYRNKTFVSTQTVANPLPKEDLMVEMDGGFETANAMANWSGTQTLVTEGARTGSQAVQLVSTDLTTRFANYTINGLKPGAEYTLSFWTKYLEKSVNAARLRYDIQFGYYDGVTFIPVNADLHTDVTAMPDNSTLHDDAIWTEISRTFVVPVNATIAILRFAGRAGTVTYLVDDFSLTQAEDIITPVGSNVLTNNSFETWTLSTSPDDWADTNLNYSKVAASQSTNATNGSSALKLVRSGAALSPAAANGGVIQTIPGTFAQNDRYTLTFDALNEHPDNAVVNGAQNAYISFKETSYTSVITWTIYVIPTSATYKTFTLNYDVKTADCATLDMSFTIRNYKTGATAYALYVDNVNLTKQTSSYTSFLDYGKAAFYPAGNLDIEYLNYDLTGAYAPETSGTSLAGNNIDGINVFSADSHIQVRNAPADAFMQVYRIDGRLCYKGTETEISLPKGMYIVKIQSSKGIFTCLVSNR
jgi:hypothetical protein